MSMLVWWMLAGSSPAQPAATSGAEPTEDELDRARRLHQVGTQWYEEGQYERAVDAFQQAYALTGAPAFLYNIANAQERGGLLRDAIETLERYRLDAPPEELPAVQRRILSIERRIVSAQPTPLPDLDAARPPPAPEAPPVVTQAPERVRRRPRWGLVAAGTSTAVVLGGVAAGSFATSRDALEAGDASSYAVSRTVNNGSLAVAGGGVAIAVLGLVLPKPVDTDVSLTWAPGGAGFGMRF